jgi:hypothetical protein
MAIWVMTVSPASVVREGSMAVLVEPLGRPELAVGQARDRVEELPVLEFIVVVPCRAQVEALLTQEEARGTVLVLPGSQGALLMEQPCFFRSSVGREGEEAGPERTSAEAAVEAEVARFSSLLQEQFQ